MSETPTRPPLQLPPFPVPTLSTPDCPEPSTDPEDNDVGISSFFTEAKSRIVRALMKPPNFQHSSSNTTNADGVNVQNLNFVPFQPISPPSSPFGSGDKVNGKNCYEVDLSAFKDLETQLANPAVEIIVTERSDKPAPAADSSPKSDPVNLEGLEGIFAPPSDVLSNKMPISVYAELIAMYDQEMNGRRTGGRGFCGSDICCASTEPDSGSDVKKCPFSRPVEGETTRHRCDNKERNLRKSVLKWNKDD